MAGGILGTSVQLSTILMQESFLPYTMLLYFTRSLAIFAIVVENRLYCNLGVDRSKLQISQKGVNLHLR